MGSFAVIQLDVNPGGVQEKTDVLPVMLSQGGEGIEGPVMQPGLPQQLYSYETECLVNNQEVAQLQKLVVPVLQPKQPRESFVLRLARLQIKYSSQQALCLCDCSRLKCCYGPLVESF
jgi:hypothetical protein